LHDQPMFSPAAGRKLDLLGDITLFRCIRKKDDHVDHLATEPHGAMAGSAIPRSCKSRSVARSLQLTRCDFCSSKKTTSKTPRAIATSLQRMNSATTRCVPRSQYLGEVRGRVYRRGDPIRNAVMAKAPLNIFTVPLDSVGADMSPALLKS
jgi:hypothetical protein